MLDYRPNTAEFTVGLGLSCNDVSDDFILKICDYFTQRTDALAPDDSMWKNITSQHSTFVDSLKQKNLILVKHQLNEMFMNDLTDGTAQGAHHYYNMLKNDNIKAILALIAYSKLLNIMQYTGLISTFYPENSESIKTFEKHYSMSPNIHLNQLSTHLNVDISAPKYSYNFFGLATDYGIYSWRDFISLGIAIMINEKYSDKNIQICEIGGGVGHLAFYLNRFGFNNITIVDLPTISVTQMYFLGINNKNNITKLISPNEFDGNYDLVLNVDSMTEMPEKSALEYLGKIKKNSRLISINHEINPFKVSKLCDNVSLKRTHRFPFWLRKGYVYEEYERL